MNNFELVEKCKHILNLKTKYALGCFGQNATPSFIDAKARQYPDWYTSKRITNLKSLGDDYYLFDCVNMIKSILWGFPNFRYGANGCPDINADGLINRCDNVTSDFKGIVPGAVVWVKGHVGVYIGNGRVIECTSKWKGCVQMSICANVTNETNGNVRTWKKWGKMPYIEYINKEIEQKPQTSKNYLIVCTKSSNLNCRANPDIYAPVIGRFKKNTIVEMVDKKSCWVKVKGLDINNHFCTGWCSDTYLKGV